MISSIKLNFDRLERLLEMKDQENKILKLKVQQLQRLDNGNKLGFDLKRKPTTSYDERSPGKIRISDIYGVTPKAERELTASDFKSSAKYTEHSSLLRKIEKLQATKRELQLQNDKLK